MPNQYPAGGDPSATTSGPLKVSGHDTAPNHTPVAIIGAVAFAAVILFWVYHFSTASNPTSPVTNNTISPWTTGAAR